MSFSFDNAGDNTISVIGDLMLNINTYVSIVIVTADRAQAVLDCVESFRVQVPCSIELIIVDAGHEEPVDSVALVAIWPNAKIVRASVRNASLQRNIGVREAIGEIIIFLDDDTLVNPGWWPAILEPFRDAGVAVVQGGIHNSRNPRLRSDRGGYVKWNGFVEACIERGPDAPHELDWPMTTNMAVKKSVYETVGGLEPSFVIYDEDVDFGLRVRKAGWRIVHQADASVYHYGHRMWRPPATKRHAFRIGRNRTMMLVRNYGLFGRVWLYLLVAPWVVLGRAIGDALRLVWRIFGHAFSQCVGMVCGIAVAVRGRKCKGRT